MKPTAMVVRKELAEHQSVFDALSWDEED